MLAVVSAFLAEDAYIFSKLQVELDFHLREIVSCIFLHLQEIVNCICFSFAGDCKLHLFYITRRF